MCTVSPPGLWEMWESRTTVRLFQAAVGIRFQTKWPQAIHLRISMAAAFSTGFLFLFCFFFLFLLKKRVSLGENRLGRVTNHPPYGFNGLRRLSSAIGTGNRTYAQMMSCEDSTIRIMNVSCRTVLQGAMEYKYRETES